MRNKIEIDFRINSREGIKAIIKFPPNLTDKKAKFVAKFYYLLESNFVHPIIVLSRIQFIDAVIAKYPNDYEQLLSNFGIDVYETIPLAGTCLEYFNGVLYYAVNNFVFCSKPFKFAL